MSAPKRINHCFNCGADMFEGKPREIVEDGKRVSFFPNLTYEENARYSVKCHKCGQYIEFNAKSYDAALEIYQAQFEGQTIHPIEELSEDDGFVLGYNLPIEEPPRIIHVLDTRLDEHTHFSKIPTIRCVEVDGEIKKYKWGR